ncbi:MAG TPA: PASTA domain-containing protein [Candidatus Eisenbacteria bacterium]
MSSDPPRVLKLPERRRLSRRVSDAVTLGLIALLAFAIGITIFNNLIMPRLIHSSAEVRVPDLSNLSYDQAGAVLAGHQLRLGRSGGRFDPSVPAGFILAQDPLPGTPVRVRRKVMVMVSEGEEFTAVPGTVGSMLRGAAILIEHAGLGYSGSTVAPSDELGEGMVVASDPAPGTVVPHNWPVGLLLSNGPPEQGYVMPSLLGRDFETVQAQLIASGFDVRSPRGGGVVIFQNPSPGSWVAQGAAVFIQGGGGRRSR